MNLIIEKPFLVLGILAALLLIFILLAAASATKSKRKPSRKKTRTKSVKRSRGKKRKDSVEIDPHAVCAKYKALSQTEQKKMKADYLGRLVEIPTYVQDVKKSDQGNDFRAVVLQYKHQRTTRIQGELKLSDYPDQSWMTREGQLRVQGKVREIGGNELRLDEMIIL